MNNLNSSRKELRIELKLGDLAPILNEAFRNRIKVFGEQLHLYYPSFSPYPPPIQGYKPRGFPSFSITGDACALRCEHCYGKLLGYMTPTLTPERLREHCFKLHRQGGAGCLISGGCSKDGSVPLDNFIGVIREVKHETGLKIVVHTGLASPETLRRLADTGVDVVSFDLIGSDLIIREIYHLSSTVKEYERMMRLMSSIGLSFVPHINIGLYYGAILGEHTALDLALNHDPSALVFIVFTPFKDTPMEKVNPPKIMNVAEFIAYARVKAPHTPIALGCIRPLKTYRRRFDSLAVRAGINGLAYPSVEVYRLLPKIRLKPVIHDTCCSLIFQDAYRVQ
ncbi:MAG: radical SAM protein [Candidatus Bathyarchaeia archaeon]